MAWDGVLVRYGEIGIKSQPVRRQMTQRLRQNMLDMMLRDGVEGDVQVQGSRLWMVGPDAEALLGVARRTFGVVSASLVQTCPATMEAMGKTASAIALERDWTSFAIRARRSGEHPFTSNEVGIQVGSTVYKAAEAAGRSPKVDLSDPELEILIEVRDQQALIGTDSVQGPGGIPLGSQGKVVCLLNDQASAVAAWLMMRRGCRVLPIHAGDMGSAPLELSEALQRWGMGADVDLLPVCSGAVSKAELLDAASHLARKRKASAIVSGDTIDSDLVAGAMPVLRPLCGLDPQVVADLVARLDIGDVEPAADVLADDGEPSSELLRMHRVVTC